MVPVYKDQGIPGLSIINPGLVKHIMILLTIPGLSILTLMVPVYKGQGIPGLSIINPGLVKHIDPYGACI